MKKYHFILPLLCLLCLSGCGKQREEAQADPQALDWKKNGFAVGKGVVEEQALWVNEYIPWEHGDVTWNEETEHVGESVQAACCGEKIYKALPIISNGEYVFNKCYLEIYDTGSMETSVSELDLEKIGIKKTGETRKLLRGIDVLEDGAYAFHVLELEVDTDEKGGETYTQLFNGLTLTDSEGNAEQVDWRSFFETQGLTELGQTIDISWRCDRDGNSYIRTGTNDAPFSRLYILNPEGKLVMDHQVSESEQICAPMKTQDGDLIFLIWNINNVRSSRLVWFDVKEKQVHTVAAVEDDHVKQLYGMVGNDLYYENGFGIVKWNVESGVRKLIFRYDRNGIDDAYQSMLVLRKDKPPILRVWGNFADGQEDWIVTLSEYPTERSEAARIVSLTTVVSQRVRNSVPVASRMNPNYAFTYEESEGSTAEDYRSRIMAELAAGHGPDVMFVSLEDMEILYEKDMLADLREYLSEEALSKILPGVLEMGTVDGTLAGIAPEISARSLLVGESVWSGDNWTLDDILELMESGKLENKIYYEKSGSYYGSLAVVRWLTFDNLESSFLIDWENRGSHFEDDRFIRLLKCVGKYDSSSYEGLRDDRIGGGGSLMVFDQISTLQDAAEYAETHGVQGSHYVGFPSERGNGSYLDADGVVVVNKNASDPAAVSAYLEGLLGNEVQMNDTMELYCGLPVINLPADEYGEVNSFLAQCVPAPRAYEDITDIIYEELDDYYAGDQTAEKTAEIIDNRVQLYLDEM